MAYNLNEIVYYTCPRFTSFFIILGRSIDTTEYNFSVLNIKTMVQITFCLLINIYVVSSLKLLQYFRLKLLQYFTTTICVHDSCWLYTHTLRPNDIFENIIKEVNQLCKSLCYQRVLFSVPYI